MTNNVGIFLIAFLCINKKNSKTKIIKAIDFLKIILTTIFGGMLLPCLAQNDSVKYIFTGQILGPDSIPVDNVYLVNYRNVRGYATNEEGRFRIPVLPGDSLKTAHISFKSIIIKVSPPGSIPIIFLSFEDHLLFRSGITRKRDLKREEFELNNFYRNWNKLLSQMQSQGYYCTRSRPKPNSDQLMGDPLINNFSFTGNPSLSLSPEAIYKKIRSMNLARKQRKNKKE
jgi:hypothetical protein